MKPVDRTPCQEVPKPRLQPRAPWRQKRAKAIRIWFGVPPSGGSNRLKPELRTENSCWKVAPGREVEQFNFVQVRMQRNLRDAGIFNFERIGLGQRQFEQNGQQHADDAAVTKNRGRPARMPPDDFKQARL